MTTYNKRSLFVGALLLAVLFGVPIANQWLIAPKPDFNNSITYDAPDQGIVRLLKKRGDFICSATVIRTNLILTAAHCIEEVGEVFEVRKADNVPIQVTAQANHVNYRQDIAVLDGDFKDFTIITISEDTPTTLGMLTLPFIPKVACGYPWGGALLCLPTRVIGFGNFDFYIDAPLYPGMSGGPLMALDVQVAVAVAVRPDNASIVTPLIEPDAAVNTPLHGQTIGK